MKWTAIIVTCLSLAFLASCGGGGTSFDQAALTGGSKEWLGKHEASIPDRPQGTVILEGE